MKSNSVFSRLRPARPAKSVVVKRLSASLLGRVKPLPHPRVAVSASASSACIRRMYRSGEIPVFCI